MVKENAIHRIIKYLKDKGVNHHSFEKEIGVSNGYLNTQLKRNAGMGELVLNKILSQCDEICPTWLLTGEGKMLRKKEPIEENNSEAMDLAQSNWITIQKLFGKISKLEKMVEENKELIQITPKRDIS